MTLAEKKKHEQEASSWVPHMVYVWPNATLKAWYEIHGAWAFYNGVTWAPKARKLHVGMNEVRFVRHKP